MEKPPRVTTVNLAVGEEHEICSTNQLARLLIQLDDGTEFECTLGPNEKVRFRRGRSKPTFIINPPEDTLGEKLRTVD